MTIGIVIAQTMSAVAMLLIGYILGRMYTSKAKPGAPKPICMCKHNFGSHKDGRKCQVDNYDNYHRKISTCACLLYVGPDPILSGLWHPPAKDKDS